MDGLKTTVSRAEILEWAETRGGRPAKIKLDNGESDSPEIITILLEPSDESKNEGTEEISWDDFFYLFDLNNLAFVYKDRDADGKISNYFEFLDRDQALLDNGTEKGDSDEGYFDSENILPYEDED